MNLLIYGEFFFFLMLATREEALMRGTKLLVGSLLFVFALSIIAFYILRLTTKSLREETADYQRFLVKTKKDELIELAEKKKIEEEQRKTLEESLKEEERLSQEILPHLMEVIEMKIGSDCPHCQTVLSEETEITVCPLCETVHHRVCFDLNGCINSCKPKYVAEYPSGGIRKIIRY